jgi:hypothetical protein
MKTLKQIREESVGNFVNQVDHLPDEMMLEEKGIVKTIPSSKEMPSLLIFRRISYRLYPNKQVVALYYSKLLNKYLSIPFGPDGNLNLSESKVYDSLESLEEGLMDAIGGAISGYAKGGIGGALKGGMKGLFKGKEKDDDEDKKEKKSGVNLSEPGSKTPAEKGEAKHYSTWEKAPKSDPVYQARLKQASLKENKIADIRKMVSEGIESTDLSINGRQVTLNTSMAKRILEVYDSVNTKNKKIVESMLNEDLESFKKLLNFSIKA